MSKFDWPLKDIFGADLPTTICNVPQGLEALVLVQLLQQKETGGRLAHICADHHQLSAIADALSFFAPWLKVIELPAWDCLPYDRVSPSAEIVARRIAALSAIVNQPEDDPVLLLMTANAALQRYVPRAEFAGMQQTMAPGNSVDPDALVSHLAAEGFERVPTVRERGEFAVRGGIVDVYAPGSDDPVRLDFFGDTLESIRTFDPQSQRTTGQVHSLSLQPMSEIILKPETVRRFRANYVETLGAATRDDALYRSISESRRFAGMEHWLPLFFENLETIFDYLSGYRFTQAHNLEDAATGRLEQIEDHYQSRVQAMEVSYEGGTPYKPVEPASVYLAKDELAGHLNGHHAIVISPFDVPETSGRNLIELDAAAGRNFAPERAAGKNVFDAVASHINQEKSGGKAVLLAAWTKGSADRLKQVLEEHGVAGLKLVANFGEFSLLDAKQAAISVFPLESGFSIAGTTIIAEQDILGDRLVRRSHAKRKNRDVIAEASSLGEGDIVVHVDHGIARFTGLRTIEAAGAPHDCLELIYAGDDKLYLPVENIELLSRYGSSDTEVQLDRLGGVAWQARKSKLKKRILEMADQLIRIAAQRAMRAAERLLPPDGLYDEFAARFPYEETEDQLLAIEAVFNDLASGSPMDRLICGDVGFGKTEVALRAAFAAVMAGKQVAVVVPTTLLARQHYKTFSERFSGLPVKVAHASRLVGAGSLSATKAGLKDGTVDIVVGTHALLSKSIGFDRLGLLVIDEEQRFGVKHKERLKELKSDVHVLTLSATPIPRTLQLALTGVRELSLITTAPVDRMAVRTFISPFDPLTVREALLRERYRGGQSFYVCPRISDIEERKRFLDEQVPELNVAIAHGQMSATDLDEIMNAFYDGKYDVLLSTTIVESGLDIPSANTLIVHRADMFGLAQLYQLRGRVGRSKVRAYAILTLPVNKTLTKSAERRLKVLKSLDTIGAGFELASHDLDIRGSGNLLGEEQSGQIREVGYELYQQMLEEAVAELKEGGDHEIEEKWAPQIAVGTPVLIPETYVPDLQLRLTLYRRLSDLREQSEIDAFAAEMIDRFGTLPDEVDQLLRIVFLKGLCMEANVERLDAGPKGGVIAFRNNDFANPTALVQWLAGQGDSAKIRPDQTIVFKRNWQNTATRLKESVSLVRKLVELAKSA